MAYVEQPPTPTDEWRFPAGPEEIVAELDLCRVPLDATPTQARRLLELNGSWVRRKAVVPALQYRRTCVVSAVSGQDT